MSRPAPSFGPSLLLLGALAAAPGEAAVASEDSPLLRPGSLELRVEGGVSLLPPSVEAGVSAELGVAPLGAGTLSLGAELRINPCLLACSVRDLFAQRQVSTRDVYALGRLGYHFAWDGQRHRAVEFSGFLLAGVMEARTTLSAPDYGYEGRGRGLAFGLGVDGHYFLSSRFFVGGEAGLRFAAGTYDLTLTRGVYAFTRDDHHWVRGGLGTAVFAGIRLF